LILFLDQVKIHFDEIPFCLFLVEQNISKKEMVSKFIIISMIYILKDLTFCAEI